MSDLTSKPVDDLTRWAQSESICSEGSMSWPWMEAYDELARRLEEAQQKIVTQQSLLTDLLGTNEDVLEAHDAEVAAKALEEAAMALDSPLWKMTETAADCLLRIAAEYRAKAGRKE